MLDIINGYIWNGGLLVLLLGTGAVVTVKIGFFQLRGIPYIIKRIRASIRSDGKAQHRVTASALAASMGTGNIAGVTAAMAIGGAGAIFWMYVSAFLGMALTYAENVLGALFSKGDSHTGAMAYLRHGLGSKALASVYAVLCICASVGMGNMTQSSTAAASLSLAAGVPPCITGAAAALIVGLAVIGGIKGIGSFAGVLLPFAAIGYMGTALAVIIINIEALPSAFSQIFMGAFGAKQLAGGTAGAAISAGLRHGVFSNEAGLGSSAVIHSEAKSEDKYIQGLWSMLEVFLDTFVCCTLTALAVLCTDAPISAGIAPVAEAFSCVLGGLSEELCAAMTSLFAVCTMLGWCCCGEKAVRSLSQKSSAVLIYRVLFCICAFAGAMGALSDVWALSDIANGLMAVPNLLAILLLCRYITAPPDFPSCGKKL